MKKTRENINEMKLKLGSSKIQIKLIKLQPDSSSKKRRGIKSTKSEMRKKLQQTPEKYKES